MIRNVMLFSWDGGRFAELAPSEYAAPNPAAPIDASIIDNGRRETYLNLDQIKDGIQAFWIAVANLYPLLDGEHTVAVTYRHDPLGSVPFVHYFPGDFVAVTDADGVGTSLLRVKSISGKRNRQTAKMEYTPTFETVQQSADSRTARWLQRATDGTMGGRSDNAKPSSVSIIKSGTRNGPAGPTFNGGNVEVGDESSPWTSDELVKVVRSEMWSKDTGLAPSQAQLIVDGAVVWTETLAFGESLNETCLAGNNIYIPPRTPAICKCTAIGHPGFTMKVYVVPVNK